MNHVISDVGSLRYFLMKNGVGRKEWDIEATTGYKPKTPIWKDLTTAERLGTTAIEEIFESFFEYWRHDAVWVTELVLVLDDKVFQHHKSDPELARFYNKLWNKTRLWCLSELPNDGLVYFCTTLEDVK